MAKSMVWSSTTSMTSTTLSGAEPRCFLRVTLLKKPSACTRFLPRSIRKALTASPSAIRNWRRMTKSLVFVLPTISTRSTVMRGPSSMWKAMAIVWPVASRFGIGLTWAEARPWSPRASIIFSIDLSTASWL